MSREVKRIFSCYGATVYLPSEDKEHLILQNSEILPPRVKRRVEKIIGMKIPTEIKVPLKVASLYRKVLQEGKPQLINDPETIQTLMTEFTENKILKILVPKIFKILGIRSVINVPLVSEGDAVGLLDISRGEPFTESDLHRLEIISGQVAAAIEYKQTEEALKESEKKYSTLIEKGNDGIIIIQDSLLKFANSKMIEITGFSGEEALGKPFVDIVPPEYKEFAMDRYRKVTSGEEVPDKYESNPA